MITRDIWTKNYWLVVIALAATVRIIFAFVGPGEDYFRCYTWMVTEPERLHTVAEYPWTLNPPYLAIFMAPFVALPGRAGYILFMAASLAMIIFSTRYLGGKPIPLLLSAHLMWILWWGQVEAWGVVAVVIGWTAYRKQNWVWMFLALILASFKPQVSFIPVMALLTEADAWLAPDNYQEGGGAPRLARRTSPTNVGMGLLSTLAAHDLGYLSTDDLLRRLDAT